MLDHFDFLVKWMPKHSYNMLCCYKQYRKSLSVIWIYEFNFFTNNEIAPLNIRVMVKQSLKLLLFSHSVMSDSLPPHELQHARLPCPSPSPGACSNSCSLSQWCHPTISSSAALCPPALSLSHHQSLFQWVGSLHQVAKVLELQLQHQSFQWIFRIDFLWGFTGLISL